MPINKKSRVNNVITWLHLWLGLVSGMVVVILGITGCLYSYQQEFFNAIHKNELFIQAPAGATILPMSVLRSKAQLTLGPDKPIQYITTYQDPNRTWEFMCYEPGNTNAVTLGGSIKHYESVFLNPYTGEVAGDIDYMHEFFSVVKGIHVCLLLNLKYGEPIVGIATLIFVITLITGLIMWYPRRWTKKHKDRSFKIRWNNWKHANHDLHKVVGFYALLVALVLGLSGAAITFGWVRKLLYTSKIASIVPVKNETDQVVLGNNLSTIDRIFTQARKHFPTSDRLALYLPDAQNEPVSITAYHIKGAYYDYDQQYFDQSNGQLQGTSIYKKQSAGVKAQAMNYDIHIGNFGGLFGKTIAFLVSLISASLPVTGFIIWWDKKRKKNKKEKRKRNGATASVPVYQ